jgi:hypothetical protein
LRQLLLLSTRAGACDADEEEDVEDLELVVLPP